MTAEVLQFRSIDLFRDWATIVAFHRDVFEISFGSDEEFSESNYRTILQDRSKGQRIVLAGGAVAGQVEIWTREYEGRNVGYASLFYLVPRWRGQGLGRELLQYAERYFCNEGLGEYHLRVSERNEHALRFYLKQGFVRLEAEERDDLVTWRMMKSVTPPC